MILEGEGVEEAVCTEVLQPMILEGQGVEEIGKIVARVASGIAAPSGWRKEVCCTQPCE